MIFFSGTGTEARGSNTGPPGEPPKGWETQVLREREGKVVHVSRRSFAVHFENGVRRVFPRSDLSDADSASLRYGDKFLYVAGYKNGPSGRKRVAYFVKV